MARMASPENEAMIGPYAQCVRHCNASPLTYEGTNTWVLSAPGDTACVVVDPGPAGHDSVRRLADALDRRGLTVSAVLLTHAHPDHAGCAEEAGRFFGAQVMGVANGLLGESQLQLPGLSFALEVISLPGHSSDSVGFYLPESSLVVTGDTIFAQSSTLVCWPDGCMADYLRSLDALARIVDEHGVTRVLTAHGPVIERPAERIGEVKRHRYERLQQIRYAISCGVPPIAETLADVVYRGTRSELRLGVVWSVNAQLRYLFEKGVI